jgi:hypothetical protein
MSYKKVSKFIVIFEKKESSRGIRTHDMAHRRSAFKLVCVTSANKWKFETWLLDGAANLLF